jgi:hypothetical protein
MSWTHIEDTTQRARKRYQCELCLEAIEKGDVYVRRYGVSEDGKTSFLMHPECERETKEWNYMEWESFQCGDFERPKILTNPAASGPQEG